MLFAIISEVRKVSSVFSTNLTQFNPFTKTTSQFNSNYYNYNVSSRFSLGK